MKRNHGYAAIIPLLILGLGLIVAVLLVGRQTFFKPRASEPIPSPSPWGKAVKFTSSKNSFINIHHNYASPSGGLKIDGSFTVELWVRPEVASKSATLVCKMLYGWGSSTKTPFCLKLDKSSNSSVSPYWAIGTKNYVYTQPGGDIPINQWSHLAVTVDANNGIIRNFINGRLGSTNGPIGKFIFNDPDEGIFVGASTRIASSSGEYTRESFFDGQIDELRISDGVRYISDFKPANIPFGRDSLTRGLWHFDILENMPECGALPSCYRDSSNNLNAADAIFTDSVLSTIPYTPPTPVNRPPVAKMVVGMPADTREPVTVKFLNASTDPDNDAMTFLWDFGNGQTSTVASPTATFKVTQMPKPESQTFTVKLTAIDSHGASNSATTNITILANHDPIANFNYQLTIAGSKAKIALTNLSTDKDGDVMTYEWKANGKVFSTAKDTVYNFSVPLARPTQITLPIVLTTVDSRGGKNIITKNVIIPASPSTRL